MNLTILKLFLTLLILVGAHPRIHPNLNGDRIIGGHPADISDAPFLVSVLYYGYFECAGSLISSRWILTAADCIYLGVPYTIRVNSSYVDHSGQVVDVQSVVVHPKYSLHERDNNFALMELVEDVDLKVVELPELDEIPEDGAILDAFGWGYTWDSWYNELRAGSLPVIDRERCQNLVSEEFTVTDRIICAGNSDPESGDNLSYGDAGSPLVDGSKLIGVASYDYGNDWSIYPAIYGRVSSVLPWIHATIAEDLD